MKMKEKGQTKDEISDVSLAFSSVHVFAGFTCSEIGVLVNDGKSLWKVADSIYTH